MAKQGMKRFEPKHPKNDLPPVPQIQGKARTGKEKARPLIPGTEGKVWHTEPYAGNDLARDNQMDKWDMTAADRQDFRP